MINDEHLVLGINRTSDASVCLLGSGSSICSTQKERLTRQKHDWGAVGDLRNWYADRIPGIGRPLDLVVECFSSDAEIKNFAEYRRELREVLKFRGEPRVEHISHHLAHVYSTFYLSPFDEAAVMIIDFQGSRARDFTDGWDGSPSEGEWVEVSSFYKCEGDDVRLLGKQLWDEDGRRPVGLGCFYNYLTRAIFPGAGNEGKVMGLAPYGDPRRMGLPPLRVSGEKVFIPDEWLRVLGDRRGFRFFQDGTGSFEDCADLAAAGQRCFEDALLSVAEWLRGRTGARSLCFAGGTALNCVANGRLLRESGFEDVFVPPSPHDGGTALGCAVYGLRECLGLRPDFRWVNDFTGPEPSPDFAWMEAVEAESMEVERPDDLLGRMVDMLAEGEVVGLYQGRSELGPRALGHRSILADPRGPDIKSWINARVKGRESFRPLAPAALEESASKYFDVDRPVPFMQFAVDLRPEYRGLLPAVTHVDGTARLQTVGRRDDEFFHALLERFEERTGVGVLLNTSFNGPGEPIVETPAEAFECFKATQLDALVIPPHVIRKKARPGSCRGGALRGGDRVGKSSA